MNRCCATVTPKPPTPQIKTRRIAPEFPSHDIFARLLAAREVSQASHDDRALQQLLAPELMLGLSDAAKLLANAQGRVTVVADYDCDGATAAALAVRGLRALRPDLLVDFMVPDRQQDGYGLSDSIVHKIIAKYGDLGEHTLLTVDNGIASIAGVQLAISHGLQVIVTDHHLPMEQMPAAHAIVNPNQHGCEFPSKALAGVGVVFYVLIALRAQLRLQGASSANINLLQFADLVALGTVADVVPLDRNNRLLVEAGLQRIRSGKALPGIRALLTCAGRNAALLKASDLAFYIGPRINAAGRLQDMAQGIACLLADEEQQATLLAESLEGVNQLRRERQAQAVDQAITALPRFPTAAVLVAFDPLWHEGLVGLVAGRLKETYQRPAFAFAPALNASMLKGSGRSIPGLHLRDMLDFVSKQAPEVLVSFGGHAMAAGLTLHANQLPRFEECIDAAAQFYLRTAEPGSDPLHPVLWTDGSLVAHMQSATSLLALALQIEQQIWGQGFPEPVFDDEFDVIRTELLGEKHLRMEVRFTKVPKLVLKAMHFFSTDSPPAKARMLYRLSVNRWNGKSNVELQITNVIN